MKAQRLVALFKKNMKVIFREPAVFFIVILFPVVLCLAFGAAFGALGTGNGSQIYTVGVVNLDPSHWGTDFTGNLSDNAAIVVKPYTSNESAQADLQQGHLSAVIVIPSTFGNAIDSYIAHPSSPTLWTNATIYLAVDQASIVAKDAIPPIMQQALVSTMLGKQATALETPVSIGSPALVTASKFTQFDTMVPGLFAFAAIFVVMSVSQSFVGEREKGLLKRIGITPTEGSEIIGSQFMSYGVTAVLQVAIVAVISALMGFHFGAGVAEFSFAFLAVILLALINVGFGLIIASVAKNSGSATGIAFIVILPEMFLGTFVPASQSIAQFVPSYYVSDALASLFLRGATIVSPAIWMDLGILCVYCAIVVIIGILMFNKIGRR
jgi:ABC-2 type transport system permease protein